MRLKAIVLENFRSFKERTRIELDSITAIVGKNDQGKSSILEALEIFFNSKQITFSKGDICVFAAEPIARIGCVFVDLPNTLTIDARSRTTLADEYLLNSAGELEIHNTYDGSGRTLKAKQIAFCNHPTNDMVSDLLLKKQGDLRTLITEHRIPVADVDQRSNVQLRRAIRNHHGPLVLGAREIPLDGSDDTKEILKQLQLHFPQYALFRSDRPSQDADAEVQDPLKVAITQALRGLEPQLQIVEEAVRTRATEVANRTLDKLRDIDEHLASQLTPDFKADRKWDKVFSFELMGDHGIPVNKRGSGVRRLILLSFFRAEAERLRTERNASELIYAIEEPETSQNPHNQRLLIEALLELADQDGVQVIITTHTPGIAGLVPREKLRHIRQDEHRCAVVSSGTEEIYLQIARELGVTADKRLQLLICVEGPSDVEYLRHFSKLLHQADPMVVDISTDPRVAIFPVGGSNLEQWVKNHYLKPLNIPEFHLYDRGTVVPPKFQAQINQINQRVGHCGILTGKAEIENYLHADAIREGLGVVVAVNDATDIPIVVSQAVRAQDPNAIPWDQLSEAKIKECEKKAKGRLQNAALPKMTLEMLQSRDPDGEVLGWMTSVGGLLS